LLWAMVAWQLHGSSKGRALNMRLLSLRGVDLGTVISELEDDREDPSTRCARWG
jgi:hypothetical protein